MKALAFLQGLDLDAARRLEARENRADLRLLGLFLLVWFTAICTVLECLWMPASVLALMSVLMFLRRGLQGCRWSRRPRAHHGATREGPRRVTGSLTLGIAGAAVVLGAQLLSGWAVGNSAMEKAGESGSVVQVSLRVVSEPRALPGQRTSLDEPCTAACTFEARVEGIEVRSALVSVNSLWQRVSVRCGRCGGMRPGAVLWVRGTLELPADPGRRPVFTVAGVPTLSAGPDAPADMAARHKDAFGSAVKDLPLQVRPLVRGMITGDTSGASTEFTTAMKTTGLTHLVAVSGANCTIIVTAVLILLRYLGLPRIPCALLSVAVLFVFVLVVGPEPSVTRASWMAAMVFVCHALGYPAGGASALFLCCSLLLATDPYLALDPGFILSVAATLGIVLGVVPMSLLLSRFLPPVIATMIAIPLLAQVACQPILIFLSPQFTPYAVLANLLVAPLVTPVTLLGFVSLVVAPFCLQGAQLLAGMAGWCASVIWSVAEALSTWPAATLDWPAAPWGIATMVLFGLLTLGLIWILGHAITVIDTLLDLHQRTTEWLVRHDKIGPRTWR